MLLLAALSALVLAGCGAINRDGEWVDDPKGPYRITCDGVERAKCLDLGSTAVASHRNWYLAARVTSAAVRPDAVTICATEQAREFCTVRPSSTEQVNVGP